MEGNVNLKPPVLHLPKSKPIDISFENLTYTVKDGKGKKQIVKGVSGTFKSGELTAIMGPSGAGKTSLLNILTGFQVSGTDGIIKSNGVIEKKRSCSYRKQSRYILQDDSLDPLFDVRETMTIAANLKLGRSISEKGKEYMITDILDTLGLTTCENTKCAKLSGGQKKRLSVALELLDNPAIMFLDEPTTGLDSSSSSHCIKMLKSLAQQGRNIICTIHQPSASLFEMFDLVYVMAEGKCIYQDSSLTIVPYLASIGFNCPKYHNPADYVIEIANGEYGNFTEMLANVASEHIWQRDTKATDCDKNIDSNKSIMPYCNDDFSNVHNPSELYKLPILIKRSYVKLYRDWTISSLRLALHVVVGTFLGLNYYNVGNNGSQMINNVGFLVVSAVYLCYTSLMPAVLKFPSEMAVLKKENFNNWYNLKTYYIAFLIADIPMQIVLSIAYTSVSYFLTAQPTDLTRFVMVVLILSLVSLIASSMGLVFGTITNPVNGTFFGAILTAVFLVVAGFLMLFTHMSTAMYALSYVSYLAYALEGLVQAVYGYNREPVPCPEDVEYCHYRTPEVLLKAIGMHKQNYWIDVGFLLVNFLLLRIIAFCTLKKKLSSG